MVKRRVLGREFNGRKNGGEESEVELSLHCKLC